MKKIVFFVVCLFCMKILQAQDFSLYEKKLFIREKDTLRYRILWPENYHADKKYPLIVFLHGSGERGNDNALPLVHGGDLFLKDSIRKKFPAIIIFPQCPQDSGWSVRHGHNPDSMNLSPALSTPEALVKALMDSLAHHHIADEKRIYLGGLSLGGFGTYDLVIHYPKYFAAAFPICGIANTKLYVDRAKALPVWIFHGALDDVVSPQPDRDLYKALQDVHAKEAKYTEYPNANHNSWDSAFAEPELLAWLFSKHK